MLRSFWGRLANRNNPHSLPDGSSHTETRAGQQIAAGKARISEDIETNSFQFRLPRPRELQIVDEKLRRAIGDEFEEKLVGWMQQEARQRAE